MKPLRIFVALVLFAGASLTARAMYLHAKADLASVLIHRAWGKTVVDGRPHPPWPWADTYPVARLRIPRLGYDEVVLEGATPRTLAFGPARLFSGAGLGEPGNVELAGHRTSWFRPLENLDARDEIQVQWFDARKRELRERTYTVDDIRIVTPEEVTSLVPASDDSLTLITCYPFGHHPRSPQRFVVIASPAGPSRLAEPSRIAKGAQL
ncbi:MAG TPA: class GN sortase [Candidatus Acidoferrum sp.]|nr:class GN sortase [Candidatus Acidoferrum sp.]